MWKKLTSQVKFIQKINDMRFHFNSGSAAGGRAGQNLDGVSCRASCWWIQPQFSSSTPVTSQRRHGVHAQGL